MTTTLSKYSHTMCGKKQMNSVEGRSRQITVAKYIFIQIVSAVLVLLSFRTCSVRQAVPLHAFIGP